MSPFIKTEKIMLKEQLFIDKIATHTILHIITLKKLPFNCVRAYNIVCNKHYPLFIMC